MKSDLAAARERIRQSDEMYKKKEAEYQATIAAMQKRIEDLEGKKNNSRKGIFAPFLANFEYVTAKGVLPR